jgi:lipopolysaccharide export system protein LptC
LISLSSLPRPVLTAALLLTGLASWYLVNQKTVQEQQAGQELPHVPQYFVRNLDMTSMGTDGFPERHVESINMIQYLDDETTEMESPRYNFFRSQAAPWNVKAEQGWLSSDGELALLSGRVTIIRPAHEKTPSFKMVTSELRVQPDNNYMETDNHVNAKSGKDVIDAVGMQAWMGEPGRIKFLSEVKANYVPR